jgi:hypothetical protein
MLKIEPEPKTPTGDAALCGAEALESTLEGAAEEEEEAVAALDGAEPKRDAPLKEEVVAALDGAEPEGDPPAKGAKGVPEVLENTLEGAAVEEVVAAPDHADTKTDAPSEGTETVLRGDERRGAESFEDPPEGTPEGTALGEPAVTANSAKGDGPEAAKSAKGDLSDGIALREAAELATLREDADGPPGGAVS